MANKSINKAMAAKKATRQHRGTDGRSAANLASNEPVGDQLKARSTESVDRADGPVQKLFESWDSAEFVPNDHQFPVEADSLEASIGYSSLFRQMHQPFVRRVAFYTSEMGGSLSVDEARQRAFHPCKDRDAALEELDSLLKQPVDSLNFADLLELHHHAPRVAERFWENVKVEARKEFESGHLAANISFPVGYKKQVWNIARYIGVRESFVDEWRPRGGVELSLIDMMAQCFFQWQYWLEQSVTRTECEPRLEHPEYKKWKKNKEEQMKAESWATGHWFPPCVDEQAAIDHAIQTADRWHRMFMRTLRQMRE